MRFRIKSGMTDCGFPIKTLGNDRIFLEEREVINKG